MRIKAEASASTINIHKSPDRWSLWVDTLCEHQEKVVHILLLGGSTFFCFSTISFKSWRPHCALRKFVCSKRSLILNSLLMLEINIVVLYSFIHLFISEITFQAANRLHAILFNVCVCWLLCIYCSPLLYLCLSDYKVDLFSVGEWDCKRFTHVSKSFLHAACFNAAWALYNCYVSILSLLILFQLEWQKRKRDLYRRYSLSVDNFDFFTWKFDNVIEVFIILYRTFWYIFKEYPLRITKLGWNNHF